MKIHEKALYPFSVLYDGITRFRNHLYELEIKKSCSFEPVVINVGNLAVGGTGKTPMIEYLIGLLQERYQLATLSRGYGRRTYGFRLAAPEDTALTLGDEPFQLYQKWKEKVIVAVGERRAMAIPQVLYEHPEVEVFLLDDAYQHRPVRPDLNILLTTWQRPFFRDYVLPAGRLREGRRGAARAHAIVVTKCPGQVTEAELEVYRKETARYAGEEIPVYFSSLAYDHPQPFSGPLTSLPQKVVLVSGLARADLLEQEVGNKYQLLKHFRYSDHHPYTAEELVQLKAFVQGQPGCALLTTEKDAVKWLKPQFNELLQEIPVFVLPVRHQFLEGKEAFEARVLKTVAEKMKV